MESVDWQKDSSVPRKLEDILMKVTNLNLADIKIQQSCITLIAKIKSEGTLRLRKLEKAQFIATEFAHKLASMYAGLNNTINFDLRCIPGIDFHFQDLYNITEPELTNGKYKSNEIGVDIQMCITQIKGFIHMKYYLDSVYDYLKRNYVNSEKQYIEPSAQEAAVTLKIYDTLMWLLHRYIKFILAVNFDFSTVDAAKQRCEKLQPIVAKTIFNIFRAIAYKNEKIQRLMWKNKEFLVLEGRGLLKQYGELDLVNMIIDNDTLLLTSSNLDDFTGMVINRMSKDNFDVVLEILAKLSKAVMNETIATVAVDIVNGGSISKHMQTFEDLSVRNFKNL